MRDFVKKGKEAHENIDRNKTYCSAKTYLSLLHGLILNDKITLEQRKERFIDVSLRMQMEFNTFFDLQQTQYCQKLLELVSKKKRIRKRFKRYILLILL